jgi:hypothetical protein
MPIPKRSAAPASYILRRVDGIGLKVFDLDRPIREVSLSWWYEISVRSALIRRLCQQDYFWER